MITISPKNEVQEKVERLAVGATEAAAMLGVSERTLWTWKKEKRLPSVKIGRRVLFPVEGLRRLVGENTQNGDE